MRHLRSTERKRRCRGLAPLPNLLADNGAANSWHVSLNRDRDCSRDAARRVDGGEGLTASRDERDSAGENDHPAVGGLERVVSRQDNSRIGVATGPGDCAAVVYV